MVKNVNIKTFLIGSFGIVLLLMILLGGASVYYTQKLANETIEFYEKPHTVQTNVEHIRRLMTEIGSSMKEAMVFENDSKTEEVGVAIDKNLQEMNTRITLVKERFSGDQQLLLEADAVVADWLISIADIRAFMQDRQYEQAVSEFETGYIVLENSLAEKVIKISDLAGTRTDFFYNNAQRSKVISLYVIIGTVLFTVILAVLVCSSIIRSIVFPLKRIKEVSDSMSNGDLQQVVEFEGENEFGQLAKSMKRTTTTLSSYVDNIDEVLDHISNNNMTVTVDMEYIGDFRPIKNSMERIINSLSLTVSQIEKCANQVASGADMVADSAQMLSSGSAEQAASVEELSAGSSEISEKVANNADYTEETHQLVNNVGEELALGNEQMRQMLSAMTEINNSSDQIAKIIKTIEDIAFQTNILALNAAVEAARAGEAGKGFAVVADEVRNLAAKSAEAAKSTTQLIQNSIHAVENGTKIADSTAATLESVVSGAGKISDMIAKISLSSEDQATSLAQMTEGINQVSQVVGTNSATAEESAAASEELKLQVQTMKSLVDKFKLKS